METKETKDTKRCRICNHQKSLDSFASQMVNHTRYWRHDCKSCFAAATKAKRQAENPTKPLFDDQEMKNIKLHKDKWNNVPIKEFHSLCELKMGIQSFYRYARTGKIDKMLHDM